eukprot:3681254-Pleurochrysis_carterae.AAC.1
MEEAAEGKAVEGVVEGDDDADSCVQAARASSRLSEVRAVRHVRVSDSPTPSRGASGRAVHVRVDSVQRSGARAAAALTVAPTRVEAEEAAAAVSATASAVAAAIEDAAVEKRAPSKHETVEENFEAAPPLVASQSDVSQISSAEQESGGTLVRSASEADGIVRELSLMRRAARSFEAGPAPAAKGARVSARVSTCARDRASAMMAEPTAEEEEEEEEGEKEMRLDKGTGDGKCASVEPAIDVRRASYVFCEPQFRHYCIPAAREAAGAAAEANAASALPTIAAAANAGRAGMLPLLSPVMGKQMNWLEGAMQRSEADMRSPPLEAPSPT